MRALASILLAIVACLGSCTGTTDGLGASKDCVSVACKLATVESGTYVPPDDPMVADFQTALDALAGDCPDSQQRLGDMAVNSQELLANGGVSESLLSILQSVDQSIPSGADMASCSDIFASYVILRGGEA